MWKAILFLAVIAKVVVGTVTGVTPRGARLPGARRLVFTGVQRAHVSTVGAIITCKKIKQVGIFSKLQWLVVKTINNNFKK